MSQVPTQPFQSSQTAQNGQVNAENEIIPPQKTSLYLYDYGNGTWVFNPDIYQQFYYLWNAVLPELRETINQKWTQQQANSYVSFIDAFSSFLQTTFLAGQVAYQEDFQEWINYYQNCFPIGFELYEKQLDYVQKRDSGHDFKNDKKKNKDPNAPKQEVKEKKQRPAEEKQKVVTRQGDPQINIQKLMNTQFDPEKYLSTAFLAKDNVNIVFIGHVDAGKSTLTGKILKQLKQVDEQQLNFAKRDATHNKMEAFQDASISDIIPEERVDGKTREFAKLNFSLQKKRFTLFDAPGHKNYVPNMIMGACQADIAVLIISAKEGEFESGFEKQGQTKEHAMLAKALGVIELIVTVTKMGTVNWSEKRFNLIKEQVQPFLEKSCGFHNVVFIPVQSLECTNIHKRVQNTWYNGPSFLQYIDNVTLPIRKPQGPLRIPIIDKFKDVGNLYIYGKIESGTVIEDHTVTILPQRTQLVIRQIYNAKDQRMPFALAGQNVKLKVKNIDQGDFGRGDMICNNLNYCQESSEFKATIKILELPDQKKLLSSGYQCVMHMHAIAAQVEILKVDIKFENQTGKRMPATFLKAGDQGICVIKVQKPLCLEKFEFMPSLGRFTLRDEGKTIGYGKILGIKPAKTLLKQQKQQLVGQKKQQQRVQEQLSKLQISKTKN